ncbi:MAG: hypothetical protein LRZ88_03880 [Candidatus Cloacimonetes bacterium]|nr:hypothetical protein [Candidatus Cloacimonadota bacterium]
MNLNAPIGSLYSELVEHCGGTKEPVGKAISGGPMMGFALPSLDAAMTKGSSGLVLFNDKAAKSLAEHACLRCARCVDICPHEPFTLDDCQCREIQGPGYGRESRTE